jgi:ABC-2 type transport system ATP-binding protein
MSIEVKGIIKSYGEQKAVNEVSFSVGKGEIVGFLGPNGAGKSTTMKMITGYLEPDDGEITVCGISVKDQPLEIKKKIGYLPEANPLYYDMYIREYLDFIAGVHNVSDPAKKIEEVIDLTGLRQESGKKIGQLSKGYKQRVGLAAALIHDPEVLILDEPTTGLDPNQIIEIREVIRNLGKDKTVLFSSHILQEVEALCDRVIIINKGQLVADDSISKLHDRKKGQYVKVSFGQAPEKSLMESLSGIAGKTSADGLTWTLETTNPDILRKQLMELSLQHNLNIVSLQSGNSSLEDIFRELTSTKNDI